MESTLLHKEELMDSDEAAELLIQYGFRTTEQVNHLESCLAQNLMALPEDAELTLQLIELVQMSPPTLTKH
jgi:transposase